MEAPTEQIEKAEQNVEASITELVVAYNAVTHTASAAGQILGRELVAAIGEARKLQFRLSHLRRKQEVAPE